MNKINNVAYLQHLKKQINKGFFTTVSVLTIMFLTSCTSDKNNEEDLKKRKKIRIFWKGQEKMLIKTLYLAHPD